MCSWRLGLVCCFLGGVLEAYCRISRGSNPRRFACTNLRLSVSGTVFSILHVCYLCSLLIWIATLPRVRFFIKIDVLPSMLILCSARIPQIVKNSRERSCEGSQSTRTTFKSLPSLILVAGLSILFFVLSLLGNLLYVIALSYHCVSPCGYSGME